MRATEYEIDKNKNEEDYHKEMNPLTISWLYPTW